MKQRNNNGVDPSKRHPGFDNCARVSGRQARHHRSELSSGELLILIESMLEMIVYTSVNVTPSLRGGVYSSGPKIDTS